MNITSKTFTEVDLDLVSLDSSSVFGGTAEAETDFLLDAFPLPKKNMYAEYFQAEHYILHRHTAISVVEFQKSLLQTSKIFGQKLTYSKETIVFSKYYFVNTMNKGSLKSAKI